MGAMNLPAPKARADRLVARCPFYYGWLILAAGVITMLCTSPGQTYGFAVYIQHFVDDLGLNRGHVSSLYTAGTLLASLAMPLVGRMVDRHGPRRMVVAVAILFTLATLYMGMVRNAVMLLAGFWLMRMLGQGALSMMASNVMNRWWVRRRGAVLGGVGVLTSVLGGLVPALLLVLIGAFGWRQSYTVLALLVAAIMLPVGLGLYRRQPEDYGLHPDGMAVPVGHEAGRGGFVELNFTRQQALRTAAFWISGLGLGSISMLSTGLQFHMISIFADAGLSESTAAAAFLPLSVVVAVVTLVSGILVDRIAPRWLLFGALACQAAALLLAPRLSTTASALLYGTVLGATGGLQRTVSMVVWPNFYGRAHLGAITGISGLIGVAGSALGPMPMGVARDLLGSYDLALTLLAILPAALAIWALFMQRPTLPPGKQEQ
jgi:sugar phosphate permease